jgi:diguanylate cyclase (GGDEF)-like protein
MLEFLADQFNTANREADYCSTLLKLFDLYCAQSKFVKAGDALDRAAEIDAYESGHHKRLEMLKGKIDDNRYQVIASRFTPASSTPTTPAPANNEEKTLGAGTLQDLMLQAEILVQYGMRNKALERLQRIQQLFPHEEDRNPELHALYMSAGMMPQYSGAQASAPTTASPAPVPAPPHAAPMQAQSDVSSFARIPEITRKLNRESSAEGVLNTTASEIGAQWGLDRCIAALRRSGLAVSAMKEFVGDLAKPSTFEIREKLVCVLHDLAQANGHLVYPDVSSAPDLRELAAQLSALSVKSLLVLPLADGEEPLGVLLLFSNIVRGWSANDVLVFKMIAEQVAISLSNAGLRRLVKNLSVTEENSGLLKRASYLDLLMGEVRRARQQQTPLSVLIMRFGDRAALAKEQGDAALEATMQRLGQVIAANVRQNDLAFRYAANAIAVVLGETAEKEALLVVEKMRRVINSAMSEKQLAASLNAGVSEAVIRQEYDAVDIVTEVINRVERALEKSVNDGPGKSVSLAAQFAAAAVA